MKDAPCSPRAFSTSNHMLDYETPTRGHDFSNRKSFLKSKTLDLNTHGNNLKPKPCTLNGNERLLKRKSFESGVNNCHKSLVCSLYKVTPTKNPDIDYATPNHIYSNINNSCQSRLSSFIDDNISPGLARLRNTPGALKEKQKLLIHQHNSIRKRSNQLQTGGGVSPWPNMETMRMTRSEVAKLCLQAVMLCAGMTIILHELHGETLQSLKNHTVSVKLYCSQNSFTSRVEKGILPLDEDVLNREVIRWHSGILLVSKESQSYFDMTSVSPCYQVYVMCYLIGLSGLVYYLLDNILAKNKLTPSRIRKWTCLLVVIGTWTVVMAYGLILAHCLEKQFVKCIQEYSESLAYLVPIFRDLSTFHNVLLYWRARFLDPSSEGLLHVFGVVSVKDVMFYLQYYSVPVITVLIGPIVKLVSASWTVHGNGEYIKADSKNS